MKGTGTRGMAITASEQARIDVLQRKVAHYNERGGPALSLVVFDTAEKPVERELGEIRLGLLLEGGYSHLGTLLDIEYMLRIEHC